MHTTMEELFASALALPATERDSFLSRACGDDQAQILRIRSLIADSAPSAEFMNEADATVRLSDGSDRIDNYRLIQELGEGGCGTVYLAEQIAPIRREVAIKIIKLGMDTKAVVARFEAERQALALMDHPNIARVLDAGSTPSGRPYFVMEVVRGIRITDYCDQCRLTLNERLELFIQICHAVQHAHAKGVLHRDIKPSNVLITLDAGCPIVKVIDFGIAKAMHGRLTDQTVHTLAEQFIGTPAYVSPEQTETGTSLDARSDVYSLGVLLYELLTGNTPLNADDLFRFTLAEARERIRSEIPARPSARIAGLEDQQVLRIAQSRRISARGLIRLLKCDVDWVVMKCLEKEQLRRYRSVQALYEDVERLLAGEPIEARPPSAIYSLRTVANRHRSLVIAASFSICVLLLASVVSTWHALRARRAEALAQQTIDSLVDVFAGADPFSERGEEFDATDLLDRASVAASRLDAHPHVQARLLESVGRIMLRRGLLHRSAIHLERAVRIRRSIPNDEHALAVALVDLATSWNFGESNKRVKPILDEAEELIARNHLETSLLNARFLTERARQVINESTVEQARSYLHQSILCARRAGGPDTVEEGTAMMVLGTAYMWTDDFEKAESTYRDVLRLFKRRNQVGHSVSVETEAQLGRNLHFMGRNDEAVEVLENALKTRLRTLGRASSPVGRLHGDIALVKRAQGELISAEAHVREAIDIFRAPEVDSPWDVAYYTNALAFILLDAERYAEAESRFRDALLATQTLNPTADLHISAMEYGLAEVLLATNRLEDAARLLVRSLQRMKKSQAPIWRVARIESALGETLYRQGRKQEGERYILESYQGLVGIPGVDSHARQRARQRVIELYRDQKRQDELGLFLVNYPETHEGSFATRPRDPSITASAHAIAGAQVPSSRSSATVPEPKSLAVH